MNYRGQRVLVTGADGFIGSHLAERLVRSGADVVALALYNSFDRCGWLDDLPDDVRKSMRVVRGDIRDAAFVRRLVEGRDVVFHLAALIAIPFSYESPQSFVDTNVTGTLNVLEAARHAGVRRVVHTSTSEVYGTALFTPITEEHPLQGQSPYSASKIGADMMAVAFARSFETPVVVLRPFNTYGPRQSERAVISSVIRQALDPNCGAIEVGDLTPRRDFTFVEDMASAFAAAGLSPALETARPYNAGTGRAVTIGEMVEIVGRLTGCNKPTRTDTQRMRPAQSEVRELLADAGRFHTATGWRAGTTLEDGLGRTIEWWRRQLAAGKVRSGSTFVS